MSNHSNIEDHQDTPSTIDPGVLIFDRLLTEDQLEDILQEWEKSNGIVTIPNGEVPE